MAKDSRIAFDQLTPEDQGVFNECRTAMRRQYLEVLEAVHGVRNYNRSDDLFLDFVDVQLLTLFSRGNRLLPTEHQKAELASLAKLADDLSETNGAINKAAEARIISESVLQITGMPATIQNDMNGHKTPLPPRPQMNDSWHAPTKAN